MIWFSASISPCTLPPRVQIDDRVGAGREDVAGAEHVGAAEEDQAVAVGMGVGHVIDHHGFAVEEEILGGQEVFVVGPIGFGNLGWLPGCGLSHAVQDIGLGDDAGRPDGLARHAELGHCSVSAGMVGVDVRVDDPANRAVR